MSILCAWLLADLISGLVHWWEDRAIRGSSRFKFINQVREDNERHHQTPGYFLRLTWWENVNSTLPYVWAAAGLIWLLGGPTLIWLALWFSGWGNLVHRFAHEPPSRLPRLIIMLQKVGIFQSNKHHRLHHYKEGSLVGREESDTNFCAMTNWLNPLIHCIIRLFLTVENYLKN